MSGEYHNLLSFYLYYPGPALGIGRECDGLGPMPLGALNFFMKGGIYRNTGFMGGLYSKVH